MIGAVQSVLRAGRNETRRGQAPGFRGPSNARGLQHGGFLTRGQDVDFSFPFGQQVQPQPAQLNDSPRRRLDAENLGAGRLRIRRPPQADSRSQDQKGEGDNPEEKAAASHGRPPRK